MPSPMLMLLPMPPFKPQGTRSLSEACITTLTTTATTTTTAAATAATAAITSLSRFQLTPEYNNITTITTKTIKPILFYNAALSKHTTLHYWGLSNSPGFIFGSSYLVLTQSSLVIP